METTLQDLRNDADVIGEYLGYIDNHTTQTGDAYRYTQRDGSQFLIIQTYGDFVKEFNTWARESKYYERLVEETRHDCNDDEDWWIDYLTESNYGYDESYMACHECGNVIRYNPSSGYKDNYWINENGTLLCEECIRENAEEYITEHLIINYEKEVPTNNIPINHVFTQKELEEFGFELIKENLEVGMYGTYDDPIKILQKLTEENHNTDYICHCTNCNPFATYYEIWKRKE